MANTTLTDPSDHSTTTTRHKCGSDQRGSFVSVTGQGRTAVQDVRAPAPLTHVRTAQPHAIRT